MDISRLKFQFIPAKKALNSELCWVSELFKRSVSD